MATKIKFTRAVAVPVAQEIAAALAPACHRLVIAGSLRRGKELVGDVEILYISKVESRPVPGDMFQSRPTQLVDLVIADLLTAGIIAKRLNARGSEMFGEKNKLVTHVATDVPVDLFATTEDAWHNYLVCRTGPAELNTRIAKRARERGLKWNPYGSGFTRLADRSRILVRSEADVFRIVGLPYAEPKARQ